MRESFRGLALAGAAFVVFAGFAWLSCSGRKARSRPLPAPRVSAAPARPAPETPAPAALPQTVSATPGAVAGALPVLGDPVVRIGLATDLDVAVFPYGGGRLRVEGPVGKVPPAVALVAEGVEVAFAVPAGGVPRQVFRVQVAAIGNLERARTLARDIEARAGVAVEMPFNAAAGAYQIRAGAAPTRAGAEELAARLRQLGFDEGQIVAVADGPPGELVLRLGTATRRIPAGEYRVASLDGETMPFAEKSYRGHLAVVRSPRGRLNVVNVIGLDDYVKGVIPNEMGPKVFDELESLKAQAVAARTYAMANLGEFRAEGYDICPTPRCQVYGGAGTEHQLSTQAVEETRGEVMLHGGTPINALYTSTCGGRTEDVTDVFPDWSYPYLRGVRCLEGETFRLDGDSPSTAAARAGRRIELDGYVVAQTFRDAWRETAELDGATVAALTDRVAAGLELTSTGAGAWAAAAPAAPASGRRRHVYAWLLERFRLTDDLAWNAPAEDFRYLFPDSVWESVTGETRRHLVLGARWKLWPRPAAPEALEEPLSPAELASALEAILRRYEVVREIAGKLRALDGRTLTLRVDGKPQTVEIPPGTPLLMQTGVELGSEMRAVSELAMIAGDRVRVLTYRGVPKALVLEANPQGMEADRTSNWRDWSRSYTRSELEKSIRARTPLGSLDGLAIAGRGSSGRVTGVTLRDGAAEKTLTGLEIRWSLGLPENLFSVRVAKGHDGEPMYHFFGKGWGHGVGLCQVGAFGLAVRGLGYRAILEHYYTGIRFGRAADIGGGRGETDAAR